MRRNTDAQVSGGAAGSSDEAAVMAVERGSGVALVDQVGQPCKGEEPVREAKPFGITKREVWEAYRHVKANKGVAGIDDESIEMFEVNLKGNLYRVWNRMCSGSYFPPAVKLVEIPKKDGGVRTLGIPTVSDRVAQTVVKKRIEPRLEELFHPNSYGFRPGKCQKDAIEEVRYRCGYFDWVVEFDIHRAFDELDHIRLMKAVRMHVKDRWTVLYIERWLKAPFEKEDGTTVLRDKGVPQGSVIGPILMNLFMHFCFDRWMQQRHGYLSFVRYADDAVVFCKTKKQAQYLLESIGWRLRDCGLKLNLRKSSIVYCRDSRRQEKHACQQFTFLGFTFKPRTAKKQTGEVTLGFLPGVSQECVKEMLQQIRRWKLPRQTNASIQELAARYNPKLRGWFNYYGQFRKTALRRVYESFEAALARWARRKYKKLQRHIGRSFKWIWRVARRAPGMFFHWRAYGQAGGRAMGAV